MSEKEDKDNYQFQIFGRYLILDHLVDGGMAKIYRARFLGEKADKIVAIKMVQPAFNNDKNFQEMFDNELKLAFALHHPNICQTYDYGKYKGTWYTAMEYIDGKNLKQFLDRLKKRNESFPIHLVTFIISQVCQGLYYAHTFTEKLTGEHYNIIHRDISPHNIMVTYDGAIKVIDFGIAKTELANESTQAGTIKGKLSYLAPEYIEGVELDQRYDMFAVGITLWEMLCGKKLFTGTNDLNVINQIRECNVPAPSTINPTVPKELDHIVLKALNRDRDLRYKDMNAFSRALLRFLYTHYPDFNPLDVADFSRDIFSEEIKKDREKLLDFGKMDIQPFINEVKKEGIGDVSMVTTSGVDPATVERLITDKNNNKIELELDIDDIQNSKAIPIPSRVMNVDNVNRPSTLPPPPRSQTLIKPNPIHKRDSTSFSTIKRKNRKTEGSDQSAKYKSIAGVLLIFGVAFYFLMKNNFDVTKVFTSKTDQQKSRGLSSNSVEDVVKEQKTQGVLYFENYELSMEIKINDKEEIYSPLGVKVPLDKELKVVVRRPSGDFFERRITLSKNDYSKSIEIPHLENHSDGTLTINKKYKPGSSFVYTINGRKVEEPLPLRNYRIPAGSHRAIIIGPDKKIIDRYKIEIRENQTHVLE
jgi:serine/threonine protein kinase